MKAVVQRVLSASVTVDSHVVSSIDQGLLVLAAISPHDTSTQVQTMAHRLLNLKLFDEVIPPSLDSPSPPPPPSLGAPESEANDQATNRAKAPSRWRNSCLSLSLPLLMVSQFTLYAHTAKGHKPSFHNACPPDRAKARYDELLATLREMYGRELEGGDKVFGQKKKKGTPGKWDEEERKRLEEEERGRWREKGMEMVKDGVFGAMMQVALVNDGPVTVEVVVEAPAAGKKGEEDGEEVEKKKAEKKEKSKEKQKEKKGKQEKRTDSADREARKSENREQDGNDTQDMAGNGNVNEILSGDGKPLEKENGIRIELSGGSNV